MAIKTLTIIGGGSAYTPGLMLAILHHLQALELEELRLYDVDSKRLRIVHALLVKMASSAEASLRIHAFDQLSEALQGCDAVLNSARPGGLTCRRIDETVPLEFGVPGQETVGPGGFFFAVRSIPAAHQVANVLRKVSPEALFINYTNPSNIVTQALLDRGDIQVIGLCDQSDEDLQALAEAMGFGNEEIAFRCIGLNHATWYSDISFGGTAVAERQMPEALPMPHQIDEEHELRFRSSERLAAAIPGYWPNSYLPYYYEPELFVAHSKKVGPRSDVLSAKMAAYFAHFEEEAKKDVPQIRIHRGSPGFGDLAVGLLRALSDSEPRRLVVNLQNDTMTDLFEADTVIEARLPISKTEVTREALPAVPPGQEGLLKQLEQYQRATARALTAGDVKDAITALSLNPLVGTERQAEQLIKEAEKQYPTSEWNLS